MAKPNYVLFPIDLTLAGEKIIRYAGQRFAFVRAEQGSSLALSAKIEISLGDGADDFIPASVNTKIWADTLSYKLRWEAQAGVTAYILISRAREGDGVDIDAPPSSQIVVSAASGNLATVADNSIAAGAQEQLVAADATRREVIISNLDTAATFRVGDVNAGVARGIPLAPGQTLILETTSAVYAYNTGGAAASLAVSTL